MVIENIISGLDILLTPTHILLISIAVIAGTVAGAVPGFTGTNTVAIALPFTLAMEPEAAVIFLAAIYVGAEYGGAIPAVLINTPGTAGATATVLDAYPMSKKGMAGQALGISMLGSAIGGFLFAIPLIFLLGPLSTISLMFGQPELFVLALFGISMLATIVADDVWKGFISGFFGLILAAMTIDPITGQQRLDFGFTQLYSELPLIPILVGLFAISELFYLINEERISTTDVDLSSYKEIFTGFKFILENPIGVLRATVIGGVIGLVPGAGTSVANFVSWSEAKRASDHPEEFGEGAPEGVIASETSNNAVTSGSLIPTLLLGIPGSGTTAVILGALLLHGIQPGPRLISDFGAEAMAILLSLLVANCVLILFGMVISKYIARVVLLPTTWIVPSILALTVIGMLALSGSMFDVWIMILFGFIGFLMRETDYPLIPLILGVILGPIAEEGFRRSLSLSQGDISIFVSSPIAIILWILTILALVWDPLINASRKYLVR